MKKQDKTAASLPYKIRCTYDALVPVDELVPHPRNRNFHPPEQVERLAMMIEETGWRKPVVVSKRSGAMTAGHGRRLSAQLRGWSHVPVSYQDYDSEEQEYADVQGDNAIALWAELDFSGINKDLGELGPFNVDLLGIRNFVIEPADKLLNQLSQDRSGSGESGASAPSLSDRFGVPPFSVLDARQGYWRLRKQHWLSLGIQSEIGRGANLLGMSDTVLEPDPEERARLQALRATPSNPECIPHYYRKLEEGMTREEIIAEHEASGSTTTTGTSIFDPVLCELVYRWFSPPGSRVLDPFAGGSVRGIVAAKLGRHYIGMELRRQQVEANQAQAAKILENEQPPVWLEGDSQEINEHVDEPADLLFSCPPYFDLEQYSDDPNDLSNMSWQEFLEAYREIIARSSTLLKPERFACFVVGDIRDKDGIYRNFVSETIRAFQDVGLLLYNECILVTPVGTLPIRVSRMFMSGRKLGKTHQNVLVFCKGDPKKATEACGTVELAWAEEQAALAEVPQIDNTTPFGEPVTAIGGAL